MNKIMEEFNYNRYEGKECNVCCIYKEWRMEKDRSWYLVSRGMRFSISLRFGTTA